MEYTSNVQTNLSFCYQLDSQLDIIESSEETSTQQVQPVVMCTRKYKVERQPHYGQYVPWAGSSGLCRITRKS